MYSAFVRIFNIHEHIRFLALPRRKFEIHNLAVLYVRIDVGLLPVGIARYT